MTKSGAGLLLGMLIALPLAAADPKSGAPAADPKAAAGTQSDSEFRDELQAVETEVVSKAVSLTTDEATKFWPVFKQFQAEQKEIIDFQIAALRQYAENYATLTDEQAVAYVNSLLERDQRIHDLRVKYLGEFSKVLPPAKAARVIHVSRRFYSGLLSSSRILTALQLEVYSTLVELGGGSLSFWAIRTRSANDAACILRMTRPRWALMVISVVPSSPAICLFNRPATTSANT